jgi:hypothetical protein
VKESRMAGPAGGKPDRSGSSGELQADQPSSVDTALVWADIPVKGKATLRIELTWDLDRTPHELTLAVDGVSDVSESESLRLQMSMDRRSKFLATLSNVLKKLDDTQSSLLANLR